LSANPHELEQTIDVLVLVKAYPQPSTKYTESVCVAGLRVDTPMPEWVRLYPVQFRLLKRERQFSKYDLIRVLVRPREEEVILNASSAPSKEYDIRTGPAARIPAESPQSAKRTLGRARRRGA
jgi:hypothetical protein